MGIPGLNERSGGGKEQIGQADGGGEKGEHAEGRRGECTSFPGGVGGDGQGKQTEGQQEAVNESLAAGGKFVLQPVGVRIARQKRGLKEDHAGAPNRGSATEPGEDHLANDGLNLEEQERGKKDGESKQEFWHEMSEYYADGRQRERERQVRGCVCHTDCVPSGAKFRRRAKGPQPILGMRSEKLRSLRLAPLKKVRTHCELLDERVSRAEFSAFREYFYMDDMDYGTLGVETDYGATRDGGPGSKGFPLSPDIELDKYAVTGTTCMC